MLPCEFPMQRSPSAFIWCGSLNLTQENYRRHELILLATDLELNSKLKMNNLHQVVWNVYIFRTVGNTP